jgi:hypothetical protein
MHAANRHPLSLFLDSLEARDLPTAWLSSSWSAVITPVPALAVGVVSAATPKPSITVGRHDGPVDVNSQVVSYLAARVGQRVGGGACAHLAVEALRASGGKFAWLSGGTLDYAWGTLLTRVTGYPKQVVYSVPSAQFKPGDVIQFTNARFRDGTFLAHHTAIVAAVDGAGRVTAVYQQNFTGQRMVTRNALDLSLLTAGYARVFRPQARTPLAGHYGFTVVNNTGAAVTVVERAGTAWSSYTLYRANTGGSFRISGWTTWGGAHPTITVAGHTFTVDDAAGYEIYNSGGGIAIRKL